MNYLYLKTKASAPSFPAKRFSFLGEEKNVKTLNKSEIGPRVTNTFSLSLFLHKNLSRARGVCVSLSVKTKRYIYI